jgi:hypothetical protein
MFDDQKLIGNLATLAPIDQVALEFECIRVTHSS